jgi:hypothetical protein
VYPGLERHGFKHGQEPVLKRNADLLLPHVHTFISDLRSLVQGTHRRLSETRVQKYLDAFCYRFNPSAGRNVRPIAGGIS